MMIQRDAACQRVFDALQRSPVVAILGARQVGKTTLARMIAAGWQGPVTHFDLEDPADLARLAEPSLTLRELRGLVILDEIQRQPEVFPLLRVLADRPEGGARFLVLGSASPDLLRQSSETLAGRIQHLHLGGLHLAEVGAEQRDTLWLRGGFPRSFLASSDRASLEWRRDFIGTYLERDLPQLGVRVPAPTLRRFWAMLSHYHGQTWNASEVARSFDMSRSAVEHYLDVLTATFVMRRLPPWHENIAKRQVKAPKIYFTDSGLFHCLLQVEGRDGLLAHPRLGASWEGFALHEVIAHLGAREEETYFWAAHTGAELDLLIVRAGLRLGFEFKRTDSPRLTRSAHAALDTLKLDALWLVHAGEHEFPLAPKARAVPLHRVAEVVPKLE